MTTIPLHPGAAALTDWRSVLAGAAVALFRYKVSVMPLLGACALAGLLASQFFPLTT